MKSPTEFPRRVLAFADCHGMLPAGSTVLCALSGGGDSMALLTCLLALAEERDLTVLAAHYDHQLRGEASQADAAFVADWCRRNQVPLTMGRGEVAAQAARQGTGLEETARAMRYAFLEETARAVGAAAIATAHTADDNAETVLMHLIRGTGLKGLGGITPVSGNVIRPMLTITRQEVEDFLQEWCVDHIEDSSNKSDAFLRNRIRHHVMPLLRQENPKIGENLSQMALRLRQEEDYLSQAAEFDTLPTVPELKQLHPAIRSRMIGTFLKSAGVKEPEDAHIAQVEALLHSPRPSAGAAFPGGVTITRNYEKMEVLREKAALPETVLTVPGKTELPGWEVLCTPAQEIINTADTFTVNPEGALLLRSRRSGDTLRLPGGSKSLKKLFIDRKIPAAQRDSLPVLADEGGILGVYSIGVHQDRAAKNLPAVTIRFIKKETKGE